MAEQRDNPYLRFPFLVDLGQADVEGPQAGFQQISRIAMEVAVTEYRNGNDRMNAPRKLAGLARIPDVTLRRGIIGSTALFEWLKTVAQGDQAVRDVVITLQSEDRTTVAMTWRLRRARIVKHSSGPLNALGSEIAVEKITLSSEWLEIE